MRAPRQPGRTALLDRRAHAAGKRLLARATATFEDELRTRLGAALSYRSAAQFTRTLTRLRAAVSSADAGQRTA